MFRCVKQMHRNAATPRRRMNEQFVDVTDQFLALWLHLGRRQEQPDEHFLLASALDRNPEQPLPCAQQREARTPTRGRGGY